MAIGLDQDALRLARACAEETPDDPSSQIALGFFLYIARRFDEAEERRTAMLETFPKSWLGHVVLACVYLAQDRATEALVSVEGAYKILCDENGLSLRRNEVFPGLHNLCRMRSGEEAEQRLAHEALERACSWDRWSASEKRDGVLPGDAEEEPGHYDAHIPFWTPLQVALGYLALERINRPSRRSRGQWKAASRSQCCFSGCRCSIRCETVRSFRTLSGVRI